MGETRLALDIPAERGPARLRLVASIAVGLAAVWILSTGPGTGGVIVAIIALVASLGWAAAYARARRTFAAPAQHFLAWDPQGLTLAAGSTQHQIRWGDVREISVDEEKLVVVVRGQNDTEIRVEPRYGGLGVYALHEQLRAAHDTADARAL